MSPEVRSLGERLEDIVFWSARLARHLDGIDRARFAIDEKTQDAASKCVEVIGEAAAALLRQRPEIEQHYPALELQAARATRNQLSHGYFSIDPGILWQTAHEDIPPLAKAAARILAEQPRPEP
jgi:uncharacterized protein with HEPN domain